MTHSILVINGPNLNLLGTRQPEVYGSQTLEDLNEICIQAGQKVDVNIECFQSNHEGAIVDKIQQARSNVDAIVINAAAYSHTSVAIHDALVGVSIPTYEVHISDIHAREEFRHFSYVSLVAKHIVVGKGIPGYVECIEKAAADLSAA